MPREKRLANELVAEHFLDEPGVVGAPEEVGVFHDLELERDGRFDPADDVFAEGALHAEDGVVAVGSDSDEFADHGVVIRRDAVASIDVGIDADAAAAGGVVEFDLAGGGLEVVRGVFGVDAALDGVGARGGVDDVLGEVFAGGDEDLLFDEVASVNFLGDGVFDLDAGVHFHEVEAAVVIDEELHGAGVFVANFLRKSDGGIAHFFAHRRVHQGRGAFLDDLLVATLDGAIAFAQMDDVPVGVGDDLKLDVVRVDDEFLDVNVGVSEGFIGFHASGVETLDERDFVVRHAHAASTAAGDGFDHDGETDAFDDGAGFVFGGHDAVAAGRNRDAGLNGVGAGGGFVAHGADGGRLGADEFDVAALANLREVGVFREETVARMDGIDVGDLGRADDAVDLQVAIGAGRRADADGFVGELNVERIDVGLGENSDGFYAEFAAGPQNAQGNFATIGDEDFSKHRGYF